MPLAITSNCNVDEAVPYVVLTEEATVVPSEVKADTLNELDI